MGYKKSYDITDIARQINAASYESSNPYNDGFVGWGAKQDLYRLKEILDEAIRRCPKFSLEKEWLREQDKKKVIKYLIDEN